MRKRKNADDRLRRLEREYMQDGEQGSLIRLWREQLRLGRVPTPSVSTFAGLQPFIFWRLYTDSRFHRNAAVFLTGRQLDYMSPLGRGNRVANATDVEVRNAIALMIDEYEELHEAP